MSELLNLDEVLVDPACIAKVPSAFALRRLVLPLCVLDGALNVAMADPSDEGTLELLRRETGLEVRALVVEPTRLRSELLRFYGESRSTATSGTADDPVALVDRVIRSAAVRHASDVHLDPMAEGMRVRFRADGELEDVNVIPAALQPAVTSRLKVMAGMDIAERRAPQDGAFSWRSSTASALTAQAVDVRMATLPVRHGERITLRLLDKGGEKLSLDRLGMGSVDLQAFEQVLASPHGLVLLTGPTGSGKTTTLYAAIKSLLKRRALNILTVEDPIEYEIPGVSQAEVDSADKVNFAKALRSLLRHDPDVIMIGEIRDAQSLDTAVKAALTGHLVLSTLHTNDAVSAVTRLRDMGLEAHLAAATLRLAAAQRLVRALCPHCREEYEPNESERLALDAEKGVRFYRAKGCVCCAGKGYRGRVGVFELFAPDDECAAAIAAGMHETELLALARRKGMRTLREDALAKCLAGVTTARESMQW